MNLRDQLRKWLGVEDDRSKTDRLDHELSLQLTDIRNLKFELSSFREALTQKPAIEYVKCAVCSKDTTTPIHWPHGGVFVCADHEHLIGDMGFGSGTGTFQDWIRSPHQAELDKGGYRKES